MTEPSGHSENITLVNRELPPALSYTENDNQAGPLSKLTIAKDTQENNGEEQGPETVQNDDDDVDDVDNGSDDYPLAAQYHQDAISQAGYGLCQWALVVVIGLALSADLAEILSVAFLIPSAGQELCLSNSDRAWLGGTVLCGMLIGSAMWGILGDKIGRRKALISAMFTNALFGVIAAFMPNYNLLMITRLISGTGAGGIVPTGVVYYSEFLGRQHRGRRLTWVGLLWSFGGVFVALMAWAIIPRTGFILMGEKQQYFCSWRVFSILCSIPAFVSTISLAFIPESPRFLLEVGREVEAILVYKWIHRMNHRNQPHQQQEDNFSELELPSRQQLLGILPRPVTRSVVIETLNSIDTFWQSIARVCLPPFTRTTLILATLWCTTAYCYYGLSVWLPEHLQSVEDSIYSHQAQYHRDDVVSNAIFNSSLENVHFVCCHFHNVVFTDLVLNHVRFINTSFVNCIFNNTRSSRTRFKNCEFQRTVFLDTDLYEGKFENCHTYNCTFLSTVVGCPIDFDINFQLATVFAQVLCTHVAVLPGTAVTAFSIDKLGRGKLLGISLFVACISSLFIWPLNSQHSIVAYEAVTNFLFMIIFSTIHVVTAEAYSTSMRTTAFGSLVALSRAMGILGCLTFGRLSGQNKTSPILMSVCTLFIACIVSVKLQDTRQVLL